MALLDARFTQSGTSSSSNVVPVPRSDEDVDHAPQTKARPFDDLEFRAKEGPKEDLDEDVNRLGFHLTDNLLNIDEIVPISPSQSISSLRG